MVIAKWRMSLRTTDPLLVLLLVLACAYFAVSYIANPARPGLFTDEGWFGYADQGAYLAMADHLARFSLDPSTFKYGPAYPILAVPFVWAHLSYDPFAIVNGLAFVAVIAMTFVVGQRVAGRLTGAIAAFGLLFATPLVGFMVQPWNSTVCIVALLAVLVVATNPRVGTGSALVLAAAPALAFAARYVDVIFIGAVALAVLILRRKEWRRRDLILAAAVAAVIIGGVLVMHAVVFGSPFTTPYSTHWQGAQPGVSDQEIGAYDITGIPGRFFGMFISPFLLGQRFGGDAVLQSAFWFVLAIPGAILACRSGRPFRWTLLTASIASIVAVAFYCSFRGAGPGSVQFGALHYFKAWWPLWAILSALTVSTIARFRRSDSISQAVE